MVISDLDNEYKDTWNGKTYQGDGDNITFHKVNASEGNNSTLSMVDRAIQILRTMIYEYFSEFKRYEWYKALPDVVDAYNTTTHSSLYGYRRGDGRKTYFIPNGVEYSKVLR